MRVFLTSRIIGGAHWIIFSPFSVDGTKFLPAVVKNSTNVERTELLNKIFNCHAKNAIIRRRMVEQAHHSFSQQLRLIAEIAYPLPATASMRILYFQNSIFLCLPSIQNAVSMALDNSSFRIGFIAFRIRRSASTKQISIFCRCCNERPKPIRVIFILLKVNFWRKPTSKLWENTMTFSFHDVMIAWIEFSISFFHNTRPDFRRIIALSKYPLILIIHRQLIINSDVKLSWEFIESNHIGSFTIHPPLFPISIVTECLFNSFFSKNPQGTDQITVSDHSLLYIIGRNAAFGENLADIRSSPGGYPAR